MSRGRAWSKKDDFAFVKMHTQKAVNSNLSRKAMQLRLKKSLVLTPARREKQAAKRLPSLESLGRVLPHTILFAL